MDEVVVTATKTPESRKEIPNSEIIMNKKYMQASGAKSIRELLANAPGIDWQTYGNYGSAVQESIREMQKQWQPCLSWTVFSSPVSGFFCISC